MTPSNPELQLQLIFFASLINTIYGIFNPMIPTSSAPLEKFSGSHLTTRFDPPKSAYLSPMDATHDQQTIPDTLLDPGQLMNSNVPECNAFTVGNSQEFTSPNYPREYPHNIDCIKIIEAPEGKVVLVLFYDMFHIEEPEDRGSQCPYDYLEIRDGKFGFSPLQQKKCGRQPPTLTKSKGRHLWLRFHSDTSISYKGFKATIQYLNDTSPNNIENCTFEIRDVEGVIDSNKAIPNKTMEQAYSNNWELDCTWVIQALPTWHVFLRINEFALEKPNDCDHNKIEIYKSYAQLAGSTSSPPQLYCGKVASSTIPSDDHVLAIRFTTILRGQNFAELKPSYFSANYTVYRPLEVNITSCEHDEHLCKQDNACIPAQLHCNNRTNCQVSNEDEENCPDPTSEGLKGDILVISFLGALLVTGMCTGMILNVFRKLKQDRKEIRARALASQKSHESGIDRSEAQSQKSSVTGEVMEQSQNLSASRPSQSEDSSAESKDTVIHLPNRQSTNPIPNTIEQQPLPPPLPQTAIVPMGWYNPQPPPYPPMPTSLSSAVKPPQPIVSKWRRASSSDIPQKPKEQQMQLWKKPTEPPIPEVNLPLVPMQFVRDCACQTRESYLMARRRAPLGRVEGMEFVSGVPIRRFQRPPTPTYFPPSSASSEIGSSLERLDEEFE